MTVTDELCALLDERGVEYKTANFGNDEDSIWFDLDDKREVGFDVFDGGVTLTRLWRFTPAQVIEATLGRGECHDASGGDPCVFLCSSCGEVYDHPENERFNFCPNCGAKVVSE